MFLIETKEKYPADYDEVLDVAQAEGGENFLRSIIAPYLKK